MKTKLRLSFLLALVLALSIFTLPASAGDTSWITERPEPVAAVAQLEADLAAVYETDGDLWGAGLKLSKPLSRLTEQDLDAFFRYEVVGESWSDDLSHRYSVGAVYGLDPRAIGLGELAGMTPYLIAAANYGDSRDYGGSWGAELGFGAKFDLTARLSFSADYSNRWTLSGDAPDTGVARLSLGLLF